MSTIRVTPGHLDLARTAKLRDTVIFEGDFVLDETLTLETGCVYYGARFQCTPTCNGVAIRIVPRATFPPQSLWRRVLDWVQVRLLRRPSVI